VNLGGWGALLAASLILCGCPPAKPPVTPTATIKETELPDDPQKLIA
jgi:hypothetical protein